MSFIFYDTETTGTDKKFDQIIQFAAIKTDYNLRELDRFEIRSRLSPFVVPSPGAMRVTGVSIEQLTDTSLPSHYQMMRDIKAKLEEWSPALFIGHNSLNFDEHLLRQAFYKTLHEPYLTNTNGNCRTDSLRMAQAANLFAPNTLKVPVENGKQTYSLEHLAPINGFDHSSAHDAMGDVEATIHICRILAERVGDLWSHFIRYTKKDAVIEFMEEEEVFLLSEFYFTKPYYWMVSKLGFHPENNSEMFVYDLSINPDDIVELDNEQLIARLKKRPKPVRKVRINAGPLFLANDKIPNHLLEEFEDIPLLGNRVANMKSNPNFADRLIAAFISGTEQREPSQHVEEQIYDSFTGDEDRKILSRFHESEWATRPALLEELQDLRLVKLGERLIYTEAPEALDQLVRDNIENEIAGRLLATNDNVPWLTLPKAVTDTNDMLAVASGEEATLLQNLKQYLNNLIEKYSDLVS